ncbi:hypothetical protein NDU88_007399 [Pleurodeles waltl]|uniref:Uncharacterized protein n=1 Tax=Pleurodeles waltl TaxID=8319 RepID=A0AAV7VPN7_PLEWA|nr:hypothetical protein NDU88_007399 [Pleurodeles waltl]
MHSEAGLTWYLNGFSSGALLLELHLLIGCRGPHSPAQFMSVPPELGLRMMMPVQPGKTQAPPGTSRPARAGFKDQRHMRRLPPPALLSLVVPVPATPQPGLAAMTLGQLRREPWC